MASALASNEAPELILLRDLTTRESGDGKENYSGRASPNQCTNVFGWRTRRDPRKNEANDSRKCSISWVLFPVRGKKQMMTTSRVRAARSLASDTLSFFVACRNRRREMDERTKAVRALSRRFFWPGSLAARFFDDSSAGSLGKRQRDVHRLAGRLLCAPHSPATLSRSATTRSTCLLYSCPFAAINAGSQYGVALFLQDIRLLA